VSYKEDSDEDKTGSEDLVEVEWNEAETAAEPDNAETIEKILSYRRGKKGGNEITLAPHSVSVDLLPIFILLQLSHT
jgi:hypothetical protein